MARGSAPRNGTWWKALLAIGVTILLAGLSLAVNWGGQTKSMEHLEEACVSLKEVDRSHDVRIGQVEGRVNVLEVERMKLDTNQQMILKQLDKQNTKLDDILTRLSHTP